MTLRDVQAPIAAAHSKPEAATMARPLRVLVPLIQDDLHQGREAAERAGMPYFQAAGEKLLEAKDQLAHGEFEPWVARHFDVSPRMARVYMSLARASQVEQN